jgi:hypothetical protein
MLGRASQCLATGVVLLLSLAAHIAAQSGPVHRPLRPFPVTLWTNTSSGFTYPELSDGAFGIPALRAKLSLGAAHGCGGARAGALTAGTLRALYAVSRGLHWLVHVPALKARCMGWSGGGGLTAPG